jgi:hypothetical protein
MNKSKQVTAAARQGQKEPDTDHQWVSAVTPGRLAVSPSSDMLKGVRQNSWWTAAQKVSADWQTFGWKADFWEIGLVPRVQPGRAHELVGLIAGGGEQFGLSLAALVEAELWSAYRQEKPVEGLGLTESKGRIVSAAQEMAHRAMAELAMHYLLATGHTLANVTVRALALDSRLHSTLLDALGGWCPVGSSDPEDWLSMNKETIRGLRRIARKAGSPALEALTEPPTALVLSPAWQELDQLRGAHYHRRRPQSAGMSGVSLANPWRFSNGSMSIGGGGDDYTDGDGLAQDTTDLARRVLAELTTAMESMLERVDEAVEEIKHQNGRSPKSSIA